MQKAILAKKVGMTQLFFDNGELVPITVLLAGPCYVTQIKTDETDGYNAIQVGFWDKSKNILKPLQGIFSKADVSPKRYLREFRFAEPKDYKVGDEIKVDEFSVKNSSLSNNLCSNSSKFSSSSNSVVGKFFNLSDSYIF